MYKIKNFIKELLKNPYEKMQEQIENDTEYVKDEVVTARVIIFSSKKTHRLACEMNCLLIFYC